MRFTLLLALFVVCVFPSHAKKVDVEKAEVVAINYLSSGKVQTRSGIKLTLVHTEMKSPSAAVSPRSATNGNVPTFYVFSKGDGLGFIIVSADDVAIPVIGNSDKGNYDVDNLPPNFAYWMNYLSQQITYAIDNNLQQDSKTETQWENYLNGKSIPLVSTRSGGGEPFISTSWHQSPPYNDQCPLDGGVRSVTGCVATAMAQIMKYYEHPTTRTKEIPVYTSKGTPVGPISGSTTYKWELMDNTYNNLSGANEKDAVATLMYHCGVSVEMNYGKGASGADSKKVGGALCEYFGYDRSVQYLERAYYHNDDWESILKAEIDEKRPVLYSGTDVDEGGHAFICDGYNSIGFHMNWGWGFADGYFPTTALNVSGFEFNEDHSITIGIKKNNGGVEVPNIRINSENCLSATVGNEVERNKLFNVNSSFANKGLFDYSGTSGAALVDGSDNIICIIGQGQGMTMTNRQYYSTITIYNCSIPVTIKAGDYFIRVVAKASGSSDWVIVRGPVGDGTCPDKLPLKVLGPAVATWNPQGGSTKWNDVNNWTGGIPGPNTKVTIPKTSSYPVLTESSEVSTILFKAGAEIGRQDLLVYDKAFVEYDFETGIRDERFRMLSVPLMEVFPGDFTFGGKPDVYLQTLKVDNTGKGKWEPSIKNENAFTAGAGFVLSIDQNNDAIKGLGLSAGKLLLPFFDKDISGVSSDVHWNHSYDKGTETSTFNNPYGTGSYQVLRTGDGYRLAEDEVNVPLKGEAAGASAFALVGNPFMSTISFDKLHMYNSSIIKDNYHIWTKDGYICYSVEGSAGVVGSTTVDDSLIAPLQGFVVERINPQAASSLNFDVKNISSTANMGRGVLRSTKIAKDKLNIIAKNDKASVLTFIAKRDGGAEQFGNRDARKLMNSLSDVPEIYTLKSSDRGMVPVGVNITDNSEDVEYPLGLATSFDGDITFTFSGMDDYDAKIYFVDKLSGKVIELTDMYTFEYTFNYTPSQEGAEIISTEDRFYIRITSGEVANEVFDAESLSVYAKQGFIYAASEASDIKEIKVYNLQGVEMYKSKVNNTSYTTTKSFASGVYIVLIETGEGIKSKKVIVSNK